MEHNDFMDTYDDESIVDKLRSFPEKLTNIFLWVKKYRIPVLIVLSIVIICSIVVSVYSTHISKQVNLYLNGKTLIYQVYDNKFEVYAFKDGMVAEESWYSDSSKILGDIEDFDAKYKVSPVLFTNRIRIMSKSEHTSFWGKVVDVYLTKNGKVQLYSDGIRLKEWKEVDANELFELRRKYTCEPNSSLTAEVPETTDLEPPLSPTQDVEKEKEGKNLSASLIIDRTNTDLAKSNLRPVSNIETKPGSKDGQTVTSFACVNDLVNVSVTETDGVVDYVMSVCLPSKVMQIISSESLTDAAIAAYAYSMIPLFTCEPEIDSSWHQEQLSKASDEGDSSIIIRSYTSTEWFYTVMISEGYVTCIAARYCSQCNNNAPSVSFNSGAPICDACNNQ